MSLSGVLLVILIVLGCKVKGWGMEVDWIQS